MEREEALNMEENGSFISRQHVRVARNELPWDLRARVMSTLKEISAKRDDFKICDLHCFWHGMAELFYVGFNSVGSSVFIDSIVHL
jgi:hypothetical protein